MEGGWPAQQRSSQSFREEDNSPSPTPPHLSPLPSPTPPRPKRKKEEEGGIKEKKKGKAPSKRGAATCLERRGCCPVYGTNDSSHPPRSPALAETRGHHATPLPPPPRLDFLPLMHGAGWASEKKTEHDHLVDFIARILECLWGTSFHCREQRSHAGQLVSVTTCKRKYSVCKQVKYSAWKCSILFPKRGISGLIPSASKLKGWKVQRINET